MDKCGLDYRRLDNAFLWLADPGHAQRLADRFANLPWPTILDRLARRMNPLLGDFLAGFRHYWATQQAEYATDVLFTSRVALRHLYPRLLRHATLCPSAEDVLSFLGRKLHGGFTGEILNDCKRSWPGARVKHWMKANWIKMYGKHGCVLRVEHLLQGFPNRDVRTRLFGQRAATHPRRSAQVNRPVKRLHLRRVVAQIPRSRRWRVTERGHAVLSAVLKLREDDLPIGFLKEAA